jgi:vancomycin permeability regulator SanA
MVVEKPNERRRGRTVSWWAPRILLVGILAVAAAMGFLFASIYNEARSDETGPADAIVVLGAAQFNGTPSEVFRARLDTAYELYQQGAADTIVVTGGRLAGDRYTEAESGRNYLMSLGVPGDAILMDHLSSDTSESMRRVSEILQMQGKTSVLLVSDGFHLYRSKLLAEDNGLSAQTNDADGSPIGQGTSTELRYMVREVFAVSAYYLGLD